MYTCALVQVAAACWDPNPSRGRRSTSRGWIVAAAAAAGPSCAAAPLSRSRWWEEQGCPWAVMKKTKQQQQVWTWMRPGPRHARCHRHCLGFSSRSSSILPSSHNSSSFVSFLFLWWCCSVVSWSLILTCCSFLFLSFFFFFFLSPPLDLSFDIFLNKPANLYVSHKYSSCFRNDCGYIVG